jgi:phage-related protein
MSEITFRFDLIFLDEAVLFLDSLQPKTRAKVLYNMWKSQALLDPVLFKKVGNEVWEFRTDFANQCIRMMAFWDKRSHVLIWVVVTHGFIKKSGKLPAAQVNKTIQFMSNYFQDENNKLS